MILILRVTEVTFPYIIFDLEMLIVASIFNDPDSSQSLKLMHCWVSGETLLCAAPPPADCNLPPLSGAGSLRSPKFVRRDSILFSSNLS